VNRSFDLRIGIDVGGTNTDAVLLDRYGLVLAKTKQPTTPDVTGGIAAALDAVLDEMDADAGEVSHVMLGTTHATNAVLERRDLGRVAVLRIAGPATRSVAPLASWPEDLRKTVCVASTIVDGGSYVDGRRPTPLDTEAVKKFLAPLAGAVDGVAVTGMFSPVSPEDEITVADLVRDILGDGVHVSLGHEVGSLGLIERENATTLNAALVGVATEVASALRDVLASRGLSPATLFAQNDGTLMTLDFAMRFPVLTIGSGPANSIRGGGYLSGVDEAIVIDVGGTSTDIGVLSGGHPRESTAAAEIGGIVTNFRMPDVYSVALGGGTVVSRNGDTELLPHSVGYRIGKEALVFGGSTPTLTDASVQAGRVRLGDRRPVRCAQMLAEALELSDQRIAEAVDRMKVSREPVPVVAVGGGSHLVPDDLPGASTVVRPRHFDVANAVGAAIALAGGRWEEVVPSGPERTLRLERACEQARRRAVQAGAEPGAVEITELVEVPLAYLERPAARVTVKAAGPLSASALEHAVAGARLPGRRPRRFHAIQWRPV
jgi:N-methylhydantoinase A/oxoprolinase/acetone carboxylase beta subunit